MSKKEELAKCPIVFAACLTFSRLLTLSWLCFCVATPLEGDDDERARASLKGLSGIHVQIYIPRKDIEEDGLSRDAMQTEVELRLRQNGIRIVPMDASMNAVLSVNLRTMPLKTDRAYIFHATLELSQPAWLAREPEILIPLTPTWSVGGIGITYKETLATSNAGIRDFVKTLVDKFLNAYLSVNPKK